MTKTLTFRDLWLDNSIDKVTLRLKGGTMLRGYLFGVAEKCGNLPAIIEVQERRNEPPRVISTTNVDLIWRGWHA